MDAYSVLQNFVTTFQGGFAFVGVLLVIAGITGVVLQWRSDGGGGGAQLAGAVVSVNAFLANSTNEPAPIAPSKRRRFRQRKPAAFG